MSDGLLQYRSEFPILDRTTYLISNSLGAMPRGVYDKLREFADTWATLGVQAWGHSFAGNPTWWEVKGAVGDKIAPIMGAPAGSVLVHENASIANGILISATLFSSRLNFASTRAAKCSDKCSNICSPPITISVLCSAQRPPCLMPTHPCNTLPSGNTFVRVTPCPDVTPSPSSLARCNTFV